MPQTIFIVDDEKNIREVIRCTLASCGYNISEFENGGSLLKALDQSSPDLIILDLMMPEISGIDVLKIIRANKKTSLIPVILLTAKTGEIDKVTGLDAGANDYVTKPFGVLELMARVRAVLRTFQTTENLSLNCGNIVLDPSKRTILINNVSISVTLKEFELLQKLLSKKEHVVLRIDLLQEIWGIDFEGETRTLDMHIGSLRKKLEIAASDCNINTIRGIGYRISQNT